MTLARRPARQLVIARARSRYTWAKSVRGIVIVTPR
jgi:hypothetical protein